jgi:hypothetical protein
MLTGPIEEEEAGGGGTVYITTGIFCAYCVGWLLAGLEQPADNAYKIYQLLYMHCLLMMSK